MSLEAIFIGCSVLMVSRFLAIFVPKGYANALPIWVLLQ